MSINRSISKIPHSSLSHEIQNYLIKNYEIDSDEWESSLDAETQHLCIQIFSEEMAIRVAASSSSASARPGATAVSASSGRGMAAAEENSQTKTALFSLPDAVMRYNLFCQMDTKSLAAFANTSRASRDLAQPILDQRAVKKLFEHIRDGAIDKVKRMLHANPRLALVKWKAAKGKEEEKIFANKAGQLVSVDGKTAYEFALGEEDTEIAAELRACIVEVRNQEIANELFHKQRPAGWEAKEEKKSAPIFAQLDALTQAIRNAQPDDIISSGNPDYRLTVREGSAVAEALAQFRSMLDATLKGPVTTGRHFNPNLLLRAFQLYDNHYEDYFGNNWSAFRGMLFWQQAIGYIQRFMPVNFVQAFCDGLYNTTDKLQKGTQQGRLLRFEIYRSATGWVPSDFYPLSSSRLGFDFAIYGCDGSGACGLRCGRSSVGGVGAGGFQGLCQSKTACLQNLLSTKTDEMRHQHRFVQ